MRRRRLLKVIEYWIFGDISDVINHIELHTFISFILFHGFRFISVHFQIFVVIIIISDRTISIETNDLVHKWMEWNCPEISKSKSKENNLFLSDIMADANDYNQPPSCATQYLNITNDPKRLKQKRGKERMNWDLFVCFFVMFFVCVCNNLLPIRQDNLLYFKACID